MICPVSMSDVIVHKEDLVLSDFLLFATVCGGCREEHGIYEKSTNDAACDDCKDFRCKNGEKNDYADSDAHEPCQPCSVHCGHFQPVNILVSEGHQ